MGTRTAGEVIYLDTKLDEDLKNKMIDEVRKELEADEKFKDDCKLWNLTFDNFDICDLDNKSMIRTVNTNEGGAHHAIMIENDVISTIAFNVCGDEQREANLKRIGKA